MVSAWQAFVSANAWGTSTAAITPKSSMRLAGRRMFVRIRLGIRSRSNLGNAGIDLGDVQGWLGHKQVTTTRKHYSPVLVSRVKQASESLAGRFEKWAPSVEKNAVEKLSAAETAGVQ